MFEGIGTAINIMLVCCIIFIPLGMWKVVDIIIWFCKHIEWVN